MYKRVIISRSGGPEVLKVIEEEIREPKKDEIGVRVSAAGVSVGDIMKREGKMPGIPKTPFTPGYGIVGKVDKIGESVDGFEVGDTVAAFVEVGGYTQYAYVHPGKIVSTPEGLDPFQTACLPLNYLVAQQMLHRTARIKDHGSILVHGAGGGVGTALLDLGRLNDLTMFGTGSAAKRDVIESYGGRAIDYRTEDFEAIVKNELPKGLDAAYDPIGAETWKGSNRVLKKGGILVVYGLMAPFKQGKSILGMIPNFLTLTWLIVKPGRRAKFFMVNPVKQRQHYYEDMKTLLDLLKAEKINPLVGKVVPLEEAAEAQKILFDAEVSGNIVLDCS